MHERERREAERDAEAQEERLRLGALDRAAERDHAGRVGDLVVARLEVGHDLARDLPHLAAARGLRAVEDVRALRRLLLRGALYERREAREREHVQPERRVQRERRAAELAER